MIESIGNLRESSNKKIYRHMYKIIVTYIIGLTVKEFNRMK